MTVKRFEEYLYSGVVKKQTPDRQRAMSILEEVGGEEEIHGRSHQVGF